METKPHPIVDVARRHGLTHRALRFYEQMELIRPARDGRIRLYSERDEAIPRLIARGKTLGLSLHEIFDGLRTKGTGPPTLAVPQALLDQRRAEAERERQELERRVLDIDKLLTSVREAAVIIDAN